MGSVVQSVFNTFSNIQEVETTLITAKHMLLLMSGKVLLVAGAAAHHSHTILTHQVSSVSVNLFKVRPDVCVEGRPEATHLADIGHLSWFVGVLHVPQEPLFTAKLQLTDLTFGCGLVLTVNSLQVALQLERRQEVTETVRTLRVCNLSVLRRQRGHMLLHVRHQLDVVAQSLRTVDAAVRSSKPAIQHVGFEGALSAVGAVIKVLHHYHQFTRREAGGRWYRLVLLEAACGGGGLGWDWTGEAL